MSRRACNILVTGQTDSGKSTFVKRFLLPISPRYLILDKYQDYTDHGVVFYNFKEATDYILKYLDHDFRVIFQGESDVEYHALLHWMITAQRNYELPPLVLVIEEIQEYTSSHTITEEIDDLYRYARRWGIYNIAVSQRDVGIHTTIRSGSQVIVAFKMNIVSNDFKEYFGDRLSDIPHLEPLSAPWIPKRETHYITHPDGIDAARLLYKALAQPVHSRDIDRGEADRPELENE